MYFSCLLSIACRTWCLRYYSCCSLLLRCIDHARSLYDWWLARNEQSRIPPIKITANKTQVAKCRCKRHSSSDHPAWYIRCLLLVLLYNKYVQVNTLCLSRFHYSLIFGLLCDPPPVRNEPFKKFLYYYWRGLIWCVVCVCVLLLYQYNSFLKSKKKLKRNR